MTENLFVVLYLAGMALGSTVRAWYARKFRQDRKAVYRQEGLLVLLLASLWGIAILLPLLNLFTDWLDFAAYPLPGWAGWLGVAIFGVALWLLWRSHVDLGRAAQGVGITLSDRFDHGCQEFVELLGCAADEGRRVEGGLQIDRRKRFVGGEAFEQVVWFTFLLHDCGGGLAVAADTLV